MPTSDRESVAQTAALLSARAVAASLNQGTHVAARDAEELHRIATKLHRWAERRCNEDLTCPECNGDSGYSNGPKCKACASTGDTLGRREANAEKRAREIATPYGLRVYFQGDCRGCPVYLIPEESVPDTSKALARYYDCAPQVKPPTLEQAQAMWIDSNYNSRGTAVCHLGR